MYSFEIKEGLEKSLRKLAGKDKRHYQTVVKKILQIAENPTIGKPLRNVLKGKRRVHIGHFVLVYEVNEEKKMISFLDFEHHDDAYK
ncbi:MAG TPA: type II toxin-antitoxin system RelE/ParE family toxin [Thermodesulfovibrionales bacterium]|nr:type II toxin-antitoxin system RelE/ParE family toxin [Thermodesulfovibrionales bacterium]